MSDRKKTQIKDEYYEKASKHRQWNERAYTEMGSWDHDKSAIIDLKETLAISYGIPKSEITHELSEIENEYDEDRDDHLMCKIYMPSHIHPGNRRCIWSQKVKVPEEYISQMLANKLAKSLKEQQNTQTQSK